MQAGRKAWRESASLILLAKNSCKTSELQDFKVLVFKRPKKMSFMPNSIVFPGGVAEAADESAEWLEHFKNCGITDHKLSELTSVEGERPGIFQSLGLSALKKEISLRITAIRETFEELGVLICRNRKGTDVNGDYGNFVEDFNKRQWQDKVIENPKNFMHLCKELDLVPDVWKLYEWSVWLTPTIIPTRFETAFFLVAVKDQPGLHPHESECDSAQWETPTNLLNLNRDGKLELPPPQFYELKRIENFQTLEELTRFARERNSKGTTLSFPILFTCSDGLLAVYPGDDLYPSNPNLYQADHDMNQFADRSFEELRKTATKMHRVEQNSKNNARLVVNFKLPHGHVSPKAKL